MNMDCLEKAQVKQGPGEVVAVVPCHTLGMRLCWVWSGLCCSQIHQWPPGSSVSLGSGLGWPQACGAELSHGLL